jgi:hypothetical protein
MLLAIPLVLAFVLALVRGGSVLNIATVPMRGAVLIGTGLALQVVVYLPGLRTAQLVVRWGAPLYGVALALLLLAALLNWRLGVGLRLATVGLILNTLVIVANGGAMPTNLQAQQQVAGRARAAEIQNTASYTNARAATPHSALVWLSDIIPIPLPGGHGNVYSMGDVLIACGGALVIFRGTRRSHLQGRADATTIRYHRPSLV